MDSLLLLLQEEGVLREQLSKLQAVSSKGPRQPQVDEYGSAAAKGGRKTSVAQVSAWASACAQHGFGLCVCTASCLRCPQCANQA